jgi:hypothetical protein
MLAFMQGDTEGGRGHAWESACAYAEAGDRLGEGRALAKLGFRLTELGRQREAMPVFSRSIAILRSLNAPWFLALALTFASDAAWLTGDALTAHAFLDEALLLAQKEGDPWLLALARGLRGALAKRQRSYAEADQWLCSAIAGFGQCGDKYGVTRMGLCRAFLLLERDMPAACELLAESLRLGNELGQTPFVLLALAGAAAVALGDGAPVPATMLCARANALLGAGDVRLDAGLEDAPGVYQGCIRQVRTLVDPMRFASAWAEGEALVLDEAVQLAQSALGAGASLNVQAQPAL